MVSKFEPYSEGYSLANYANYILADCTCVAWHPEHTAGVADMFSSQIQYKELTDEERYEQAMSILVKKQCT